jgi:hypothetical protein
MSLSYNTESKFRDFVLDELPRDLLDTYVSWIQDNLDVDEVFSEEQIINHCTNNFDPDVFGFDTLRKWALENGFEEKE